MFFGLLIAQIYAQITGPTGTTGANGYSPPGAPGIPGNYGVQGSQGAIGGVGLNGLTGNTGATGNTGQTGINGASPIGNLGPAGQNPMSSSAIFRQYAEFCKPPQLSNALYFRCNSWTQYAIYMANQSDLTLTQNFPQSSAMLYVVGVVSVTLKTVLSGPIQLQIFLPASVIGTTTTSLYGNSFSSTVSSPSLSTVFNVLPLFGTIGATANTVTLSTDIFAWSPVNSTLYFSYSYMYWGEISLQSP